MKQRSFKINILVVDGIPDGLRLVEKSNWNGLGIVFPRGRYSQAKNREEFSSSGVYLLVGNDEGLLPDLYIGEADVIRERLNYHISDDKKEFWQKTFIFTTRGTPLNKAQIKYLEACLLELAVQSGRSNLANKVTPKRSLLSEADQAEMEGYMDELLTILPVLGISFFESIENTKVNTIIYELVEKQYCKAKGVETSEGFMVLKDSIARLNEVQSMKKGVPGYYDLRKQLIRDGVLRTSGDQLVFKRDWDFKSPSAAASVCLGKSANGLVLWKDKSGVTLGNNRKQTEIQKLTDD